MKAPSLRLIALLTCFAVARSHAIDVQPPTSGYGISDVYEALYPGLIYVDNPLTGDVCQPIREDITVGPYTNREKALLGVAPTVSLAMPLTMQIATGGTAVILRFPTVRGKRYQVQRGEVVPLTESNWITVQECGGPVVYKSKMVRTPVGGEIIGTGDEAVVTLAVTLVPGEPQFFSYTCLGDLFSDTDALSDWEESILGTNPLNPDTDGDHLLDDWETAFGLNPLLHDADADFDADGFTNRDEFHAGLNPRDPSNGAPYPQGAPAAPGKPIIVRTPGSTVATLGWVDRSDNELLFVIERSVGWNLWEKVGVVPRDTTVFTAHDLDPNLDYFFRVVSRNNTPEPQ